MKKRRPRRPTKPTPLRDMPRHPTVLDKMITKQNAGREESLSCLS